ncbi:MAG TPA: DegQ family serine endoprotease [Alphaproteobacteria bacterium]|nr:DegQ family serine endoprotease [Alphaproteobacteria bacterium]
MLPRALALLLTLTIAAVPALAQQHKAVPESRQQIQLSFAPLVKQAAPAVVNIYARRVVEQQARPPLFQDPFFRHFFGDMFDQPGQRRQRLENSLGSGVILAPEGLIVTNNHVIAGAEEIKVALSDRREFDARLVLSDERSDLAVLRIDAKGEALPYLKLKDSDDLEVGDLVLAIGNPFNVGQTVTSGIVSALARTRVGESDYQFFIQTDAAINPGNSGGALIGLDGRLVGINSAIYSRSGGSLGIGFAVPSNMVRTVLDSAKAGYHIVQRPWLGAATQAVTADLVDSLKLPRPEGVLVGKLCPDGPAARAGLRVGDVVLALDGQEVDSPRALRFRLGTRRIGGKAGLQVWRDGGGTRLALPLERPPRKPAPHATTLQGDQPLAGARVANLSPGLAEDNGFDPLARGVVVLEVAPGSPAGQLRLRKGDIILEVNDRKMTSVAELSAALSRPRDAWVIAVQRGGQVQTVRVSY